MPTARFVGSLVSSPAREPDGPNTGVGAPARLLVTGFRPGAGGIGRDMINLINGFAKSGVDTHILTESADNPDLAMILPEAHAHVIDTREAKTAVMRVRDFIARLQPRAVISNRDRTNFLVVQSAFGLDSPPRIVIRVGINIPAKLRGKNPVSRWRRARMLKATYPRADVLVGVSDGVCDGLRELLDGHAPPIRRIYSPMDLTEIAALAAEVPCHPWFRADRAYPLLVSVGRLVGMKDQGTMLKAFARLPRNTRLVIFGEGKQRSNLQSLANKLGVAERVDLPGHWPNPFAHVARADLFVLSSRFEGFCNALLEALIVGTPAVSTDCPSGPREILGDGRYGRLVPIGNPEAMAKAILRTLDEPPPPELLKEAVARMELDQAIPRYLDALGLTAARNSL